MKIPTIMKIPTVITVASVAAFGVCSAAVTATGVNQFLASDTTAGNLVNNTGFFDIGINFGDTSNTTINGVTFTGFTDDWIHQPFTPTSVTGGSGVTVTAGTITGTNLRDTANFPVWGGATFAGLATDIIDPSQANTSMNFIISGLDPDKTYTMQFFSFEARNLAGFETDITYTLDGVAQTGTIGDRANGNEGLIGNFEVTGETSVTLQVSGSGNLPTPFQGLSIFSVPEPGSTVLVGLGAIVFGLLRNRRS